MWTRAALALFVALTFACAQEGPPPGRPPLKQRAAAGDVDAQFTLGKNYEAGRGGLKRDFTEAQHWYLLAANQGDPFAQASLALLYRFGKGVPQDYVEAYKWFSLSISSLTGADRESVAELRDTAASHMTKQQIAEGLRLSQEWKPKVNQ